MRPLFASLLVVFLLSNASCPAPGSDPYLTADTVINAAEAALPLADSIFGQWVASQTDLEKVKAAEKVYHKVRASVASAFVLAHDAVDIARVAKQPVDVTKIMASVEVAWADLYKFLREVVTPAPASQPVKMAKSAKPDKIEDPLATLPKTLLRQPTLPK
jgi:hypothetical protein